MEKEASPCIVELSPAVTRIIIETTEPESSHGEDGMSSCGSRVGNGRGTQVVTYCALEPRNHDVPDQMASTSQVIETMKPGRSRVRNTRGTQVVTYLALEPRNQDVPDEMATTSQVIETMKRKSSHSEHGMRKGRSRVRNTRGTQVVTYCALEPRNQDVPDQMATTSQVIETMKRKSSHSEDGMRKGTCRSRVGNTCGTQTVLTSCALESRNQDVQDQMATTSQITIETTEPEVSHSEDGMRTSGSHVGNTRARGTQVVTNCALEPRNQDVQDQMATTSQIIETTEPEASHNEDGMRTSGSHVGNTRGTKTVTYCALESSNQDVQDQMATTSDPECMTETAPPVKKCWNFQNVLRQRVVERILKVHSGTLQKISLKSPLSDQSIRDQKQTVQAQKQTVQAQKQTVQAQKQTVQAQKQTVQAQNQSMQCNVEQESTELPKCSHINNSTKNALVNWLKKKTEGVGEVVLLNGNDDRGSDQSEFVAQCEETSSAEGNQEIEMIEIESSDGSCSESEQALPNSQAEQVKENPDGNEQKTVNDPSSDQHSFKTDATEEETESAKEHQEIESSKSSCSEPEQTLPFQVQEVKENINHKGPNTLSDSSLGQNGSTRDATEGETGSATGNQEIESSNSSCSEPEQTLPFQVQEIKEYINRNGPNTLNDSFLGKHGSNRDATEGETRSAKGLQEIEGSERSCFEPEQTLPSQVQEAEETSDDNGPKTLSDSWLGRLRSKRDAVDGQCVPLKKTRYNSLGGTAQVDDDDDDDDDDNYDDDDDNDDNYDDNDDDDDDDDDDDNDDDDDAVVSEPSSVQLLDLAVEDTMASLLSIQTKEPEADAEETAELQQETASNTACNENAGSFDNHSDNLPPKKDAKKKRYNKKMKCNKCGKILSSSWTLKKHMDIHLNRRPHTCIQCGKSFRQACHLTTHMFVHSGKKPFMCQVCDKAFVTVHCYRDHARIHTGEKPFKCQDCGKAFRNSKGMRQHENTVHLKEGHSRKKPYSCKICGKKFGWSSALSSHRSVHEDNRAYKCDECDKTFKNYSGLWNHRSTHSSEKPYECDICGKHFNRSGNRKRHIDTQHKKDKKKQR